MKTNVTVGAEFDSSSPFLFYTLGSCFVSHVGPYLDRWGYPNVSNPLGTSFNPISIAKQFQWSYHNEPNLAPLFEWNSRVHQLDAASKFQHSNPAALQQELDTLQRTVHNFIHQKAFKPVVIVSFGTAHAWYNQHQLVNNCHKLPGQLFERKLLDIKTIVEEWNRTVAKTSTEIDFIFTVSPVRYTKIGLQENFIGKSILRLAIAELTNNFTNCHYFPSFEIVTDELRDYSFFQDNGTHPNEQAVQVVMSRFKTYLGL